MAVAVVSCRQVRKSFSSGDIVVPALDGIDLDVGAGEFLAVTGPSGSGKTTLLHCLSGILSADDGEVRLGDTIVSNLDDDARTKLRRSRMGFVFQRLNLLPPLTVEENVQLPLVLRGDHRASIERRTAEVLDAVGMQGRGAARPRELSGGQAQRVAIARALATEPDVIWADEPTGQLDRASAGMIADLFAGLVAGGSTVILATHDPEVAGRSSRRIELVDGRLVP
ncbi:MAG: putative ABC transport system ATP-binding protein [Glaciecola sp.]|jgi:putative ABC transport system ATP-binding protein